MSYDTQMPLKIRPSFSTASMVVFLAVLWVAGGASRADALGQSVVRGVCWALLLAACFLARRPQLRNVGPLALLLAGAVFLAALHLMPLPPTLWQQLPGRAILLEAAAASGQAQPWRSIAMVPGGALNALSSLVVPVTALLLLVGLNDEERGYVPIAILILIAATGMVGLLQLTGGGFNNIFVNETRGEVAGTFANRNHFALFMALGCVLAPGWAAAHNRPSFNRLLLALGLMLFFSLLILANGSRTGLALGLLSILVGISLMWRHARFFVTRMSKRSRYVLGSVVTIGLLLISVFVTLSDRAFSLRRLLALDPTEDMRARALPTTLTMAETYFPVGAGLGSFDPIFRMHEPFDLLALTYHNHAHNDFLEVAVEAGLPGLLLLAAAVGWWAVASWRAWRLVSGDTLARTGSALLLLIMVASTVDYPGRTPLMAAVIVVAGIWLCGSLGSKSRAALPAVDGPL